MIPHLLLWLVGHSPLPCSLCCGMLPVLQQVSILLIDLLRSLGHRPYNFSHIHLMQASARQTERVKTWIESLPTVCPFNDVAKAYTCAYVFSII